MGHGFVKLPILFDPDSTGLDAPFQHFERFPEVLKIFFLPPFSSQRGGRGFVTRSELETALNVCK
ncbi:hypothetical protein N183_24480 [Sinorhizobium sp. Sb3]|nr:hypothetical protein N183_24480 [Sinorhizobium sp. Sb3]